MTREYTTKLLQLVDDGVLSADTVMRACLNYMSEYDVEEMVSDNGFIEEDEESDDEDDDSDFDGDEDDKIADDENYPDPHEQGEYPELD